DTTPAGTITDRGVVGAELAGRDPGDILQMLVELPAARNRIVVVCVGVGGKGGRPVPAEASVKAEEIAIGQRSTGEISVDGHRGVGFGGCGDCAYRVGDRIESWNDQATCGTLVDRVDGVPAQVGPQQAVE